jgi:hypothetical protein
LEAGLVLIDHRTSSVPKIKHLPIFSDNPSKLAEFYTEYFDQDFWGTDGYVHVALIRRRHEGSPEGLHHWGFTVEAREKTDIYTKMKKFGVMPFSPLVDSPECIAPMSRTR